MKNIVKIFIGCLLILGVLTSCSKEEGKKALMVGMVTDAGTIDDLTKELGKVLKKPKVILV